MPIIDIPSTVAGQLTSLPGEYSDPDNNAVGTLVYMSGDKEVRAASNSSILTAPAAGIILEKLTPTTATILYAGEANFYAGLTPGDVFLGASGNLIQSGSLPSASGSVLQKVGKVKAPDTIVFFPNQVIIL